MKFEDNHIDLTQPNLEERLTHMLNIEGFATFDHILSSEQPVPKQLRDLVDRFGTIIKHPDSDEYGVTKIAPAEDSDCTDRNRGLTSKELYLHTDGSAVIEPPPFFLFYCSKPAPEGGLSKLLDGKELYEILNWISPDLLKSLLEPNSAIFGNPKDDHVIGSVFSQDEKGIVSVRFRYDTLGYYSAPIASKLEDLLSIMEGLKVSFRLDSGQGYIINNRRCLHGRTSFNGEREMYRVLFNFSPYSRMGQETIPGFEFRGVPQLKLPNAETLIMAR